MRSSTCCASRCRIRRPTSSRACGRSGDAAISRCPEKLTVVCAHPGAAPRPPAAAEDLPLVTLHAEQRVGLVASEDARRRTVAVPRRAGEAVRHIVGGGEEGVHARVFRPGGAAEQDRPERQPAELAQMRNRARRGTGQLLLVAASAAARAARRSRRRRPWCLGSAADRRRSASPKDANNADTARSNNDAIDTSLKAPMRMPCRPATARLILPATCARSPASVARGTSQRLTTLMPRPRHRPQGPCHAFACEDECAIRRKIALPLTARRR